jgi:uroporphyrin-3 C-methyltransferase
VTEQSETPKILDEISKSNAAKASSRSTRKQQTARRRFTIVVIFLLPIVAGVLFLAYQQLSLQSKLAEFELENQRLNQRLATQGIQLGQIEQAQLVALEPIEFDDSSVRELESLLSEKIDSLTSQLADLQAAQLLTNNATDRAWKILEGQYLVGLANQKLRLEGDVVTAISQLEIADQALVDSGSSSVFAVRQAIAGDLQKLRNIEVLDREGIYLRLDSLIAEMENIDLLNSMRTEFENRRNAESQPLQLGSDTNSFLDSSFEFLGSIFVWREWEETPEAMLAPGQDDLIKQNLRLMLEQAQLALLMRDNSLFQQAMAKSQDWFQRYAVTESIQGQALAIELNQLRAIDIDPLLPALNQSLSLINQLAASER